VPDSQRTPIREGKPMNPATDDMLLRLKLRMRAYEAYNQYRHYVKASGDERANDRLLADRERFVEIMSEALLEASMLGCEAAVNGLYDLAGIKKDGQK
jgi:hypothetical protein